MKNVILYALLIACNTAAAQEMESFKSPDGKFGFRSKTTGDVVIEPKYTAVGDSSFEGIAKAAIGNRLLYVTVNGTEITTAKYFAGDDFRNGFASVQMPDTKKCGVINRFGKEVIPCIYEYVYSFDNNRAKAKKDGAYGVIDTLGKIIVPFDYQEMYAYDKDILVQKNGSWGTIDYQNNIKIPIQYEAPYTFHYGVATVKRRDINRCGVIDENNTIIVPFDYMWCGEFNEKNVIAVGLGSGNGSKLIDRAGNTIIGEEYSPLYIASTNPNEPHNELVRVKNKKGKWGFMNTNGKQVIPFNYEEIGSFTNNMYAVKQKGAWGFINLQGKTVIPFQYNWVQFFDEGISPADDLNGKRVYIDTLGNLTAPGPTQRRRANILFEAEAGLYAKNGNYAAAMDSWKKMVAFGSVDAMYEIAMMYQHGTGIPKNADSAIAWHTRSTEAGNYASAFSIGYMYDMGEGVKKDDAKAIEWYSRAAEGGNIKAAYNLALKYDNGEGIAENNAEAFKMYSKLAESGNVGSMVNLAVMYENGDGVAVNPAEAFKWYSEAANAGSAVAMNRLGLLYEQGKGTTRDLAKAEMWFQKSADNDNATGLQNLFRINPSIKNLPKYNIKPYGYRNYLGFTKTWISQALSENPGVKTSTTDELKVQAYNYSVSFKFDRNGICYYSTYKPLTRAEAELFNSDIKDFSNYRAVTGRYLRKPVGKGRFLYIRQRYDDSYELFAEVDADEAAKLAALDAPQKVERKPCGFCKGGGTYTMGGIYNQKVTDSRVTDYTKNLSSSKNTYSSDGRNYSVISCPFCKGK